MGNLQRGIYVVWFVKYLKTQTVNNRKSNAYCYKCGKYVKIKEKLKCSKSCLNEIIIIQQIRDPKRYVRCISRILTTLCFFAGNTLNISLNELLNKIDVLVLHFQEGLRMFAEYVSMMDLQKWYSMSHRLRIKADHAIHFASIVSNVMPKFLSKSENLILSMTEHICLVQFASRKQKIGIAIFCIWRVKRFIIYFKKFQLNIQL